MEVLSMYWNEKVAVVAGCKRFVIGYRKIKVVLTCIECVLAFMECFASYLWIDNFIGNFMFGSGRN